MRIAAGAVLNLFLAVKLMACSCISTGDAVAAVSGADAVFRGTVVVTELVFVEKNGEVFSVPAAGETTGTLHRVVVLKVLERFKGEVGPFAIVATGSGGGDCGYTFEAGATYLVYADRTKDPGATKVGGSKPALTTSICSFTARDVDAEDALRKIRKVYRAKMPTFYKEPAA